MLKLFLHLMTKGKTCQGVWNSIKGVGGESPLPVGGNGKFWWGDFLIEL